MYVWDCNKHNKWDLRGINARNRGQVVMKGMFYRGMVRDLEDSSLFEQLHRVVAAFDEYQERFAVLSIQVEVSRKFQPRDNLSSYSDAVYSMLEFPGKHAAICSYGEHVLVCFQQSQALPLEVLDVSAVIKCFAAAKKDRKSGVKG